MGKPAEAEGEVRKSIAIYQKLAADNPAVTDFHSLLASSHFNLGSLLRETGKTTNAVAEHRRALEIYQKLAADNPAVTDFHDFLARSRWNLGVLLKETGKPADAVGEHRRALRSSRSWPPTTRMSPSTVTG